jgi:hypothetical protein
MIRTVIVAAWLAILRVYLVAQRDVHVNGRLQGYRVLEQSRPLTPSEREDFERLSALKREYERGH